MVSFFRGDAMVRYYESVILLRETMEKNGDTQVELAKVFGVTQPELSVWLRGERLIPLKKNLIDRVANYLGIGALDLASMIGRDRYFRS